LVVTGKMAKLKGFAGKLAVTYWGWQESTASFIDR